VSAWALAAEKAERAAAQHQRVEIHGESFIDGQSQDEYRANEMIKWTKLDIPLGYMVNSRSIELSCVACSTLRGIKLVILALEYLPHVHVSVFT
jgi:hypothetical protein